MLSFAVLVLLAAAPSPSRIQLQGCLSAQLKSSSYLLTNALPARPAGTSGRRNPLGVPRPVGTDGSTSSDEIVLPNASSYRLEYSFNMKAHIGKQVEVIGTVEDMAAPADTRVPKVKVLSMRMIAERCTAGS